MMTNAGAIRVPLRCLVEIHLDESMDRRNSAFKHQQILPRIFSTSDQLSASMHDLLLLHIGTYPMLTIGQGPRLRF
jgi:hypothetical protein